MGTLTTTHCLQLKVKDAFIVVFFPPKNTWPTSLVPPQRLRRRAIWSREQGHITQAHRHEITASVCLSHTLKVCVFLRTSLAHRNRVGNYSGTNLMKTLFIWCYSLSYQSLTGYQRGWWIVFPSEMQERRGRRIFFFFFFSLSAVSCTTLLKIGCSMHWVLRKKNGIISYGQPVSSFFFFFFSPILPHEETSESLINFWIINLWPLFGMWRAYGESLFRHRIHGCIEHWA